MRLPCWPIFSSGGPTETPGLVAGTANTEIRSPSRAKIMNTSAAGALVMNRFVPLITYPAASGVAVVVIGAGSEPASGSESPNEPINSPEASPGREACRCSSVPAITRIWPASPLFVPNSERNAGAP